MGDSMLVPQQEVTIYSMWLCGGVVKSKVLAPFKRGPGLYFAISPSQHSVPARSWRPACLCLCLCRGCTVCCWLPSSCIDPSFGLHHSTTCACYVLSPDAFTMKPVRFSIVTWTFTTVPEGNSSGKSEKFLICTYRTYCCLSAISAN